MRLSRTGYFIARNGIVQVQNLSREMLSSYLVDAFIEPISCLTQSGFMGLKSPAQ